MSTPRAAKPPTPIGQPESASRNRPAGIGQPESEPPSFLKDKFGHPIGPPTKAIAAISRPD